MMTIISYKLFRKLNSSIKSSVFCFIVFLIAFSPTSSFSQTLNRSIPAPLSNHPGNIFLEGENVSIKIQKNKPYKWKLFDYDSKLISQNNSNNGYISLGKLPVGYYELRLDQTNFQGNPIVFGVVAPLLAPTPQTSPIGLDVGLSVFYSGEDRKSVLSLCSLAGINWIRDRFSWSEIELKPDTFTSSSKYDEALKLQSSAGFNILQVNHTSPKWANSDSHRFPNDLRVVFNFYKQIAQRWKNLVYSIEPWNEPNLKDFGGHIGSEIASFQKVAYLGLKAGNPRISVAFNPIARPKLSTLSDLHENQVEAYFDTFNFHHYSALDTYPSIYKEIRKSSANKPLWVSEANIPFVWASTSEQSKTVNQDLRIQAERVAAIYAATLSEGASTVFYFLLPNYSEGKVQFGLIHKDLTPRPAFIAMAAVGRLLADAKPLGQIKQHSNSNIYSFVFRARPDGTEKEVLVSWTKSGRSSILLAAKPNQVFDHLGRTRPNIQKSNVLEISTAPTFAIFPNKSWKTNQLTSFSRPKPVTRTILSSVVLQASLPKTNLNLDQSAYQIKAKKIEKIPIFIYNFSPRSIQGRLKLYSSSGCIANFSPGSIKLFSGEKKQLSLSLDCRKALAKSLQKVTIKGDFGNAGISVLSLRNLYN